MRYTVSLSAIGLAAVLTGCGGGGGSSSGSTGSTYTVGGNVTGLTGTVVLQNNGTNNLSLSSNGAFTFSTAASAGTAYDITVATQPSGQVCSVSNGFGTAYATITNVAIACKAGTAVTGEWAWRAGSETVNASGAYGTVGTAAASNTPGARQLSVAWTDASGNFWLFGGYGKDGSGNLGVLNDVWEFSPSAGLWTWKGGANTQGATATYGTQGTPGGDPGAREGASQWTDAAGNLWLFAGDAVSSQSTVDFDDVWKYNTSSEQWTWMGGSSTAGNAGSYGTLGVPASSNLPPSRTDGSTWTDSAGIFWLFGGAQLNANGSIAALYNDLWSFNPTTAEWTWVGGSQTTNAAGVYGTQGTAAAGNLPGGRAGSSTWVDSSGNVWLFGGLGLQSGNSVGFNDLWKYNPSSGDWSWMSGSNTEGASGVYGTPGAGGPGNVPGARGTAVAWKDASGNFWLFGGLGLDQVGSPGALDDLWQYNPSTGTWTWVSGAAYVDIEGVYGTQGTPASSNGAGAREEASGWLDSGGNFWMFGGYGYDSVDTAGELNDLWSFTP